MFLNYETNIILALKRQWCYYSAQFSSVWIEFSSMLIDINNVNVKIKNNSHIIYLFAVSIKYFLKYPYPVIMTE